MKSYAIFSDSSCDLPSELTQRSDIRIVPYYVSFDGVNYFKEGTEITNETFYKTLREQKVFPKTSLPTASDYIDAFRSVLSQGQDIMCLCLTSKFSGSYQCATIAGNTMLEEFPERNVVIIDSMQVSAAQGQLVLLAAALRDAGETMERARDIIEQARITSKIFVTVDSLEYLHKGGRIGKVSALAGGLLGIKPVISMRDGELYPVSKVRGRKKAISEVVNLTMEEIGDNLKDYTISVMHSDCLGEARELLAALKSEYEADFSETPFELGVTIGAHIGPTVIALSYMKKII